MADPISLAALAAMAGGSYLQSNANKQVASKQREAVNAENARQQQMNNEAKMLFQKSLESQQLPKQQQNLDESIAKRSDAINSNIKSEQGNYLPGQDSSPAIIRKIMDDKANEESSRATSSGNAQARLGAYDDINLGNLFGFTRSGQDINSIAKSMYNSSNVLPMELQAANSAGAKSRMWGDLVTGLGQAGLMAGAMGGSSPSWGSLFGKNPKIINASALKATPVTVSSLPII